MQCFVQICPSAVTKLLNGAPAKEMEVFFHSMWVNVGLLEAHIL